MHACMCVGVRSRGIKRDEDSKKKRKYETKREDRARSKSGTEYEAQGKRREVITDSTSQMIYDEVEVEESRRQPKPDRILVLPPTLHSRTAASPLTGHTLPPSRLRGRPRSRSGTISGPGPPPFALLLPLALRFPPPSIPAARSSSSPRFTPSIIRSVSLSSSSVLRLCSCSRK
ncbi:hypothetical protein B0H19DRAFT_483924 [Mycena capillaripes]|nr:hypothetical protein B0H19DRAFT_483924 [Mycena capillaripes]